nr:hypothetical protein [Tanacetum cinerariifolium]
MPTTRQGANVVMTLEAVQAMIDQTLLRNNTTDDGSQNSGGGPRRPMQHALFHISGCAVENQEILKKKLTDKYFPKGKIKKLEIELWNLKVDKYISGLPDNIHRNVMSARPKTLDDAIELANDLMDQKLLTYVERQAENKRKLDNNNSSRNKMWTITCYECGNQGHYRSDCLVLKNQGLSQVEARLVEFKTQEIKLCKKIRGLEFDVKNKNNKIENLMNELEQVKKEKDGLDNKLVGFESASKDLDTLLGSQKSNKNKEGLPEFADDTITDYSRPTPSIESISSDLQNSTSSVSEHGESSSSIMAKTMIKFVKADSPTVIKTNKVETARKPFVKYAEMYRNTSKIPKARGKNWPKNNFAHKNVAPKADLLKTASVSAARRVNTVAPRPNVNNARQRLLKIW